MALTQRTKRAYQLLLFGAVCYFSVMTAKTAEAAAATCDAMFGGALTTPDHTYTLTDNITGNCTIGADNIIIDGANLYSIGGDIVGTGANGNVGHRNGWDGYDFIVRNVVSAGQVLSNGGHASPGSRSAFNGGNAGTITIASSTVGQIVASGGNATGDMDPAVHGIAGLAGTITITNSTSTAGVTAVGGYAVFASYAIPQDGGTITITNSNIVSNVVANGGMRADGSVPFSDGGTVIVQNSQVEDVVAMGNAYSYYGDAPFWSYGGTGGTVTLTNSSSTGIIDVSSLDAVGDPVAIGGTVTLENSDAVEVKTSGLEYGILTITDTPPVVTLLGSENTTIAYSEEYVEPNATATDTKYEVTDLTDSIEIAGTVGASAGTYEITYSVADTGTLPLLNGVQLDGDGDVGVAPQTSTTTRTVIRSAAPTPTPTPTPVRSSSGSSISSRVTNLVAMGKQDKAQEIMKQWSHLFPQQTQTATQPRSTNTDSGSTSDTSLSFSRNLATGMTGNDVKTLQEFLNTKGFLIARTGPGSPGNETVKFGALTRAALIRFQKANNILPAVGYFGPVTRNFVAGIK